jgi:hypothetical protein
MKAFLVCLLVLLAPVDDAWARATPGPEDDALAAANNHFVARAEAETALARAAAPGPGRCGSSQVGEGGLVRAAPDAILSPAAPFAPDPLYLLMSLQR